MLGSLWYYWQTIKFMFSKENPKSMIHGDSCTTIMLSFLAIFSLSLTGCFLVWSLFWVVGFSYSYLLYHGRQYDIYNETNKDFCTYSNIGNCFGDGALIIFLSCLFLLLCFIIRNIVQTCRKDIGESFDSALKLTEVCVDKKSY